MMHTGMPEAQGPASMIIKMMSLNKHKIPKAESLGPGTCGGFPGLAQCWPSHLWPRRTWNDTKGYGFIDLPGQPQPGCTRCPKVHGSRSLSRDALMQGWACSAEVVLPGVDIGPNVVPI